MKISKHSHSCLLIQDTKGTLLIDPGIYTEQDQSLNLESLKKLDMILITHSHADHLSIPLIKQARTLFPNVAIYTNDEVISILEKEKIPTQEITSKNISSANAHHEKLPVPIDPPENSLFTIFDRLTHPGDSFDFSMSSEILALPITAPWGSTTRAVTKALEVKPKIIIPIHDWHWKDEARKQFYNMLQGVFQKEGIDFKPLENNEVIEV